MHQQKRKNPEERIFRRVSNNGKYGPISIPAGGIQIRIG
jgi:hypothetical protein